MATQSIAPQGNCLNLGGKDATQWLRLLNEHIDEQEKDYSLISVLVERLNTGKTDQDTVALNLARLLEDRMEDFQFIYELRSALRLHADAEVTHG